MRDVRDVNAEEIVAVGEDADFHGVVEVFGGLAVDRNDVALAKVGAFRDLAGGNLYRDLVGGAQHVVRKVVRNV